MDTLERSRNLILEEARELGSLLLGEACPPRCFSTIAFSEDARLGAGELERLIRAHPGFFSSSEARCRLCLCFRIGTVRTAAEYVVGLTGHHISARFRAELQQEAASGPVDSALRYARKIIK